MCMALPSLQYTECSEMYDEIDFIYMRIPLSTSSRGSKGNRQDYSSVLFTHKLYIALKNKDKRN